jgi:F-type H+-transporting ATPase subunit b
MPRTKLLVPVALTLLALLFGGVARAEKGAPPPAAGMAAGEGHGAPAAEPGAPAKGHGADHGPGPINWFYGMLWETDTQEPNLLFRPKGMQPPLGAMLLNTAILVYVIVRAARRPLTDALKKRKDSIMQGMDEAARMKDEAESRLTDYEEKLERLDEEVERIKREMRDAGEAERAKILSEAKERSLRMERDAQLLIEQELKAARQDLVREAVDGAIKSAAERLVKEIGAADQSRLADDYLAALDQALVSKGGQA